MPEINNIVDKKVRTFVRQLIEQNKRLHAQTIKQQKLINLLQKNRKNDKKNKKLNKNQ